MKNAFDNNWTDFNLNIFCVRPDFFKAGMGGIIVSIVIVLFGFYLLSIPHIWGFGLGISIYGISIFFWLLTAPQFRFGFASILIFIYLILINIFKKNISFEKNRFFIIFFLCLFFLNIKNINRINSEFERDDFYKFKRFPYFNEIKIKNNYENIERYKFLGIEILKKKIRINYILL